jgi:hypothetical protein
LNDADVSAALLRVVVGRPTPVLPDRLSFTQWASLATMSGITPLLYFLVDTVPTELGDGERAEVKRCQRNALAHCVSVEHELLGVASTLAEHGIRTAVLKGEATAHLDYPDPSWRQYTDVDLLIDPSDRIPATALLKRDGWVQGYALPKGHESYTHAVTFQHAGTEVDLHQRVGHRALGELVPTGELLGRSVPLHIAGADLRALDDIDRLIHAGIHMVSSRGPNRRLSSVADVLVLADRRPHLAAEVLERAERWRVRSVVERAVVDSYTSAQLGVHEEWVEAMRRPIRRRDRLVDRAYLGNSRRPMIEELAYLRLLPTWNDRWRYATGYLSTGSDYEAQHGRSSGLTQARYVVSKLRSKS